MYMSLFYYFPFALGYSFYRVTVSYASQFICAFALSTKSGMVYSCVINVSKCANPNRKPIN